MSLARGAHGGVEEVLQAQRGYVRANTALLVREVGQLRLLRQLGMRVCVPAGYAHGVLFTEAVPGTPLDEALLADSARAGELLGRVWAPLAVLHGQPAAGWPVIGERSILDTFDRKFSSDHYLDELAGEMVDPSQAGALRAVVAVLQRIPRPPVAGSALAFGDVKPEHILVGVEGQSVYLDPGVLVAPASADAARLVCRLLLWLWSRPPAPDVRAAITDGLEEFVANRLAARAVGNPRELIALILLDAI
ncbi:MAG: hypothetical protein WCF33_12495, partial [Pseudonocardiaceae bacterium]